MESRDSAHVCWGTVEPRGITTDAPGGIRNSYITRALVQTHGATDGCAACQGDAQVHVPGCRKRSEGIFDREKLPGQPREVVQQGDQRVQMEQEPQRHAPIPEPSAQPSSSSHEEPMQVSTTLRRARIPEDESDTRTVRPRLDMSARDVPEIDWDKLVVDNSSVCDTYTGLMLDEEQVKAGRETEVKRMLEFEVNEEVSEARESGTELEDW